MKWYTLRCCKHFSLFPQAEANTWMPPKMPIKKNKQENCRVMVCVLRFVMFVVTVIHQLSKILTADESTDCWLVQTPFVIYLLSWCSKFSGKNEDVYFCRDLDSLSLFTAEEVWCSIHPKALQCCVCFYTRVFVSLNNLFVILHFADDCFSAARVLIANHDTAAKSLMCTVNTHTEARRHTCTRISKR